MIFFRCETIVAPRCGMKLQQQLNKRLQVGRFCTKVSRSFFQSLVSFFVLSHWMKACSRIFSTFSWLNAIRDNRDIICAVCCRFLCITGSSVILQLTSRNMSISKPGLVQNLGAPKSKILMWDGRSRYHKCLWFCGLSFHHEYKYSYSFIKPFLTRELSTCNLST